MNWHPLPFLRLLPPFAAGILIGFYFPFGIADAVTMVLCAVLLPVMAVVSLRRRMDINWQRHFGRFAFVFWFCFAYTWTYHNDQRHSVAHFQHLPKGAAYLAVLQAPPQLYSNTFRAPVQIQAMQDSAGVWRSCSGNILASFQCDSSTAILHYGDQIVFDATLAEIEPTKNPYTFDAQWFYAMQNTHHRTYIATQHWQQTDSAQGAWLWTQIYAIRAALLAVLKKHLTTENEYAVGAALLFGVRDDLNAEIKNAYSDTGATHILAVSGMHVGILAWVWGWVLGWWKPRRKPMLWAKTALLLGVIWLFVLLAGASPSVLRAGVMFSFICGAQTLRRQSNIFNTLASSAWLLLLINPYTLFDVGFQLSYLAVIGIVVFERGIYAAIYLPQRWLRWIWKMTSVSLAAQLATTPISLYYFHQFPASFWLSGLIAVPLSSAALPIGMVLLVTDWITPIGNAVGCLLWASIWLMNAFIFLVQQLPFAVIEGIWIRAWETLLWYAVIIGFLLAFAQKKWRLLRLTLAGICILGVARWERAFATGQRSEVWAYHLPKGSLLTAVSGNTAITFVDSLHLLQSTVDFVQQNHLWSLGVQNVQIYGLQSPDTKTPFARAAFPHLLLNNTLVGVYQDLQDLERGTAAFSPQYQILHRAKYLKQLPTGLHYVFDASNSQRTTEQWIHQCDSMKIPYISVFHNGAQKISSK